MAGIVRTKVISETIRVDAQGKADCKQEISYTNNGDKPLSFKGIFDTAFHANCDNFHFDPTTGLVTPKELPVEIGPYQKTLRFELSGSIPSKQSAKLVLNYTWQQFRNEAGFERIATLFDSLTSYKVEIIVADDTFTQHLISVHDGDGVLRPNHDYYVTKEGSLVILRQHLSKNSRMAIEIRAKIRNISLPLVDEVARLNKNCFEGLVLFSIIHLLRDALPFIHALSSMGVEKDDLFIVGIPYSSKAAVIEHLRYEGYQVCSLDRAEYIDEFGNLIRQTLMAACNRCKETGKKLCIIEDGGYAVPLMHKDEFHTFLPLCSGAVEQTANGIWEDRIIEASGKLAFPVMNVAESRIKRERESPLVGKAIIENINRLLGGYGTSLTSQRIGQMGFGAIGEQLALQMKNDGLSLTLYDDSGEKRERAKKAGFDVVESLSELLERKTLIIGCTGNDIVGLDELRILDRSIFFVNSTSKLHELRYREFLNVTERIGTKKGVGTEYRLKGGRRVTLRLLADGFPVNFFEGSESIPDLEIQFIPALLLSSAAHLVSLPVKEQKIIPIPEELEKQLEDQMMLYDDRQ